jgi:phosphatidylglycerol:prolipoprotein diacylglycerol transferase
MSNWIYVHNLDPILFRMGPVQVGWYGLMYGISFVCGYLLATRRARRHGGPIPEQDYSVLMTYIILGVVLGGRLGWVIFYGGSAYFASPWRILETWRGGMSFHGGMVGVGIALLIYGRRHNLSMLVLLDLINPIIPIGLFFGRIGNFINGELFGKPTDGTWGVIFPGDKEQLPRHPSQLYEALLEGLLLFLLLQWLAPRINHMRGMTTALFLLGYGLGRFAVEFVRLPDRDIGYLWSFVTMGQLLSLPMIIIGLGWAVKIHLSQQKTA